VFEENRGLQNALKLGKNMEPIILCTEETPITCGLQSKFVLYASLYFLAIKCHQSVIIHRKYEMPSRMNP
jgi:hypothetical protein